MINNYVHVHMDVLLMCGTIHRISPVVLSRCPGRDRSTCEPVGCQQIGQLHVESRSHQSSTVSTAN